MKQFALLSFLITCLSTFGQITDTILWRESYKLQWVDFQATPDENSNTRARTAASLFCYPEYKGNGIICKVLCYFERQSSWVQKNHKLDYILKHEQGHFDLYEVYARILRKRLSEMKFKRKDLESDLNKMVEKLGKESRARQKKYDKATGFAKNEVNQQKWLKKIAEELKELEQYKNSEITLSVK